MKTVPATYISDDLAVFSTPEACEAHEVLYKEAAEFATDEAKGEGRGQKAQRSRVINIVLAWENRGIRDTETA